MPNLWFSLLFPVLLLLLPEPALAGTEKLQQMSEMFDRLDREDFLDDLDRAEQCTRQRDFSCADAELRKAKKLANGHDDQRLLALVMANREAEQQRMQGEEEQRQQALRQHQVAQEQARQQALQRQREAEQDSSGDFQWGKAAVLLGGAAVGGLGQLSSETQVQLVTGILRDSAGGQQGISNLQSTIDTAGRSVAPAATGNAGSASGQSDLEIGAQACQAAAQQNGQPYNDPQPDTICMFATLNQCMAKKFNDPASAAQAESGCNNLRGFIEAVGAQNLCNACR